MASSEAMTAFTTLSSTAVSCARCASRLDQLNALLMGFSSVNVFAGVAAFFKGAVFLAAFVTDAVFLAGTLVHRLPCSCDGG